MAQEWLYLQNQLIGLSGGLSLHTGYRCLRLRWDAIFDAKRTKYFCQQLYKRATGAILAPIMILHHSRLSPYDNLEVVCAIVRYRGSADFLFRAPYGAVIYTSII